MAVLPNLEAAGRRSLFEGSLFFPRHRLREFAGHIGVLLLPMTLYARLFMRQRGSKLDTGTPMS